MPRTRAIAAAQTIPVRGNIDANVEQHVRLARLAADEAARVLVFPELSLTGYELDLAGDLAFSENDPRLSPLISAASSCALTLIAGAPVRLDTRLHIGAFIISPDGTVEVYTKHRLGAFPASAGADGIVPPAEGTVFEPGSRNPLVTIDGHAAALAVCADTGRPSHPLEAAERGATIYLASTFIIPSEIEHESEALQTCAVRHSMAVVLANYGGPSGRVPAAGRSAIWSESGDLVCRLLPAGAGVAVAIEGDTGWRGRTVRLVRASMCGDVS